MRCLMTALSLALVLGAGHTAAAQSHDPDDGALVGVYEKSVVEVEPPTEPFSRIEVDNRLGHVRIEGHDGPGIIIHSLKRARDDQALDRLKVSLVPNANGQVRITTRLAQDGEVRRLAQGSIRIDLVIYAPRSAFVVAQVWNSDVELTGMENGADLTTNEGAIRVKNSSGKISTHSTKGRQQFDEVVGEIDAEAIAGRMDMAVIRGSRIQAVLQDGQIIAREIRSRHVTVRVTRGDIWIDGEAVLGGSWSIATYRGNVEVRLSRKTPFVIRARSKRGTVKLPGALRAARKDGNGWLAGQHLRSRRPAHISVAASVGNIAIAFKGL